METAFGGERACGTFSVGIADETRSMHSRPAAADLTDIADLNFREFVAAGSDHVRTAVCSGAGAGDIDVQLLFIKRRLVKPTSEAPDTQPVAGRHGGSDQRRLSSPWVTVEISGQPIRHIDAVIVWNERQILRDQALMAGGAPASQGASVPIDAIALAQYSAEYENLVLLAPPGAARAGIDELATRMPPEILWLYRHSVQSTFADFSVFAAMALDATLAKARQGYVNIVIALFDRCFASAAGSNEHYGSVLDIERIVSLPSYRVE